VRRIWRRFSQNSGNRGIAVRRLGLGILAVAALLGLRIWDPLPVEILRVRAFDIYQTIKPRAPTDSLVIVVSYYHGYLKPAGSSSGSIFFLPNPTVSRRRR
jgi:hypothetical protein